jgi:hypothetical protein
MTIRFPFFIAREKDEKKKDEKKKDEKKKKRRGTPCELCARAKRPEAL